jgi:hypothetical protein
MDSPCSQTGQAMRQDGPTPGARSPVGVTVEDTKDSVARLMFEELLR